MKNTKTFLLFLTIALLFMGSCNTSKKSQAKQEITAPTRSGEDILFLTLKVRGNDLFIPVSAQVSESSIVSGRVKSDVQQFIRLEKGHLTLQLLDKEKKVLKEIKQENPLIKILEYADEDGNLNTRELKAQEADSFFRLQLVPGAAFIRILADNPEKSQIPAEILFIKLNDL